MHGVIGPGGRGVVIFDEDSASARDTQAWLAAAGIPAAIPPNEGLTVRRGKRFPPLRSPNPRIEAAWLYAAALRRPAVSLEGERLTLAHPGGIEMEGDRDTSVEDVREALDTRPPPRVAVFGGAWVDESEPEYREAVSFGRLCAEGRIEIVNGGYGGIMAAVSRGAAESRRRGATIVGVTVESFSAHVPVNPWLTHEVEAVDLFARLPLICDADAWVAFAGGVGTLSEIALCWNLIQTESVLPRPLIIVGERWEQALKTFRQMLLAEDVHLELLRPAASAEVAFDRLREIQMAPGPPA